MTKIETQTIPTISTAHLTKEVAEQLTRDGGMKARWVACAPWTYGYFMYLDDVPEEAPQCLHDIRSWMDANGGPSWIRLDGAAEVLDELPSYDW